MPPLARITGAGVGIVVSPGLITVTETSTGYKAEIEPPTGKTAKELVDALPKGSGGVLKDSLNAGDATLQVTAVAFCEEPSDGSACPSGGGGGGGGGGGDDPCFAREAEACRIVDTSVAPFAAFRACFDEAAPSVAERVKMTALTGGDYILSAGKDQAYEFTRVIVNQHKLTEARRPATPAHHRPIGLAFALAPSTPPPSVSPPPHCTRAEALEHAQDRPRQWRDRAHAGPRAAGRRPVGRRAHRQGESARYPMHRESLSLVPSYPPPAPRPSLAPPRPV